MKLKKFDTKPKTNCLSTDKFGFNRPVFMDRLCDNVEDCFGGDDEGTIAQCKNAGTDTANGCCEFINIHTYTCQTTSQANGKDAYLCRDSRGAEVAGVYYINGEWIFGPDTTFTCKFSSCVLIGRGYHRINITTIFKRAQHMIGQQVMQHVQLESFKIIQLHAPLMALMNLQPLATPIHVVPMLTATQVRVPRSTVHGWNQMVRETLKK